MKKDVSAFSRCRFGSILLALGFVGAAHAQASSPAADGDEAFYQRAATCAAALEVDQLALVARARHGTPGLRPQLLDVTLLGFTYVGIAYEKGLRDPRADEMLNAARAEQKSWPAARHTAVVGECRREAQALYDHANTMEQWFANKRANARVDRFMKSLATAPGGASGASGSSGASASDGATPAPVAASR